MGHTTAIVTMPFYFSTELTFAHMVENMLNGYTEPVYKQVVIECFSVLVTTVQ